MLTELEIMLEDYDQAEKNLSYLELKEHKLRTIINYMLDISSYKKELELLAKKLKILESEIVEGFIRYNLDLKAYGNEIYQSIPARMVVYIHKLIKNSWHEYGQNIFAELLEEIQPKTVADIGFGVPTLYIKKAIANKIPRLTLFDLNNSAFTFAKEVFGFWDKQWQQTITFKQIDMESFEFVGDFELYIFQETIEHVSNPSLYLSKHVNLSRSTAKFLFSMPIGPLIPSHYISWHSRFEALKWLEEHGLKILFDKPISINPNIDLFANDPGFKFSFITVLCGK